MPCYCNTIIKINQVRQSTNENINLTIVWSISTYLAEQEDNDIEMVMFIPINTDDIDSDCQAIFEKNKYYAICEKIIPGCYRGVKRPKMTVAASTHIAINKITNRQFNSNNCPLNASLVGITQNTPEELKNNEDAVIEILVNDFTTQEHNF
ncbi:3286_t:CDS:2, partial [Racocetra persica]